MKGKRHPTEQKIRILREADGGTSIVEVSKEHISLRNASSWSNPDQSQARGWTARPVRPSA
jgi:hypothetical protein